MLTIFMFDLKRFRNAHLYENVCKLFDKVEWFKQLNDWARLDDYNKKFIKKLETCLPLIA